VGRQAPWHLGSANPERGVELIVPEPALRARGGWCTRVRERRERRRERQRARTGHGQRHHQLANPGTGVWGCAHAHT
jgi:hypothetical protein